MKTSSSLYLGVKEILGIIGMGVVSALLFYFLGTKISINYTENLVGVFSYRLPKDIHGITHLSMLTIFISIPVMYISIKLEDRAKVLVNMLVRSKSVGKYLAGVIYASFVQIVFYIAAFLISLIILFGPAGIEVKPVILAWLHMILVIESLFLVANLFAVARGAHNGVVLSFAVSCLLLFAKFKPFYLVNSDFAPFHKGKETLGNILGYSVSFDYSPILPLTASLVIMTALVALNYISLRKGDFL